MLTNNISTNVSTNSTQVRETASTRFSPLPHNGDSFRLLRVLPSLSHGSPLRCELFTSSISRERDEYIAGSYVWGSPEPKMSILLDGALFQVRNNLFRFLKAFRSRYQTQIIWLDAICINQDDIQERSHQVQEMKRIYSGAKCVYSWLGYDKPLPHTGVFVRHHTRQRGQLRCILQAEYWSRMWIVQEFILAKDVQLLLGRNRLPYYELEKIIQDAPLIEESTGILRSKSKIVALMSYRRAPKTFEALFGTFGMLPRSVPLDGVFALLGLLGDREEDLRLVSIADYSLTVWQLLQQILALKIIKSSPFTFAEQYNRYVIKGQRDNYMGGYVSLELKKNQPWKLCGADDSRYARAAGSSLKMAMAVRASRAIRYCEATNNDTVEITVYTPRWRTRSGQIGVSVGLSLCFGLPPPLGSLSTRALVEACDSRCATTCTTHAVLGFSWTFYHMQERFHDPAPTTSIDVPLLASYASGNLSSRLLHNIWQRSMEMVEAISNKVRMTAGRPYKLVNSVIPYQMETDVETLVLLSTFVNNLEASKSWPELLELAMDWIQKPENERARVSALFRK